MEPGPAALVILLCTTGGDVESLQHFARRRRGKRNNYTFKRLEAPVHQQKGPNPKYRAGRDFL